MAGQIICLIVIVASLLSLLWFYANHHKKNKKNAAAVIAFTGFLGLIICIEESKDQRLIQDGRLLRNEAGDGIESQKLQLNADGILQNYDYLLEVEAQRLQGEELDELFSNAAREAEKQFIGENLSLDCIDHAVLLPKNLQDGQIQARWKFDPENIVDTEGELWVEEACEEGILVMVSLTMTYFDEVREHSFGCFVYPKKLSRSEQLLADLQNYFEEEQELSKNQRFLRLPLRIGNVRLRWSQKNTNTWQFILTLGVVAAIAVYLQEGVREQRKEQERKEQLLKQYPDMVSKMSLLLGAGMTLSGAWERIVLNYQHKLENHQSQSEEVYEQMLLAYREMQDGVGELRVYEQFGERCGMPQYRKLSMLIIQNLRKGSAGLRQSLEKEVADAFTLRKNLAKKAGEEAGTKILLPMMLMLCIVMVIILVPAFLSFQM